jgi:Short C-terminal domain
MPGVGTDWLVVAFLDSPFLGPGLAFAGALLAGAFAVALLRRWWYQTSNPVAEASDQLSHYRALFERGAISEEEYNRLRHALRGGLTGTTGPAASGPAPPPAAPAPPTPPPNGAGPTPPNGIRPA